MIPIDLLARERKRGYERTRQRDEHLQLKAEERTRTLALWQQRWTSEPKGRYTAKLIRAIDPWVGRGFSAVNFHLTQLLTGHGHFNEYLHRMGWKSSPLCDYCQQDEDTAEHTFYKCERCTAMRCALEAEMEELITPENTVELMLRSETNWDAVAAYAEKVLRQKKRGRTQYRRAPKYDVVTFNL